MVRRTAVSRTPFACTRSIRGRRRSPLRSGSRRSHAGYMQSRTRRLGYVRGASSVGSIQNAGRLGLHSKGLRSGEGCSRICPEASPESSDSEATGIHSSVRRSRWSRADRPDLPGTHDVGGGKLCWSRSERCEADAPPEFSAAPVSGLRTSFSDNLVLPHHRECLI